MYINVHNTRLSHVKISMQVEPDGARARICLGSWCQIVPKLQPGRVEAAEISKHWTHQKRPSIGSLRWATWGHHKRKASGCSSRHLSLNSAHFGETNDGRCMKLFYYVFKELKPQEQCANRTYKFGQLYQLKSWQPVFNLVLFTRKLEGFHMRILQSFCHHLPVARSRMIAGRTDASPAWPLDMSSSKSEGSMELEEQPEMGGTK